MALTASYTAAWTMAVIRMASGPGSFAAVAMSTARTFQSVITSDRSGCDARTEPQKMKIPSLALMVVFPSRARSLPEQLGSGLPWVFDPTNSQGRGACPGTVLRTADHGGQGLASQIRTEPSRPAVASRYP